MVVYDKANTLVHVQKLDKKVFAQPEGIVFDRNGTLYISNEKDDRASATLLVFERVE